MNEYDPNRSLAYQLMGHFMYTLNEKSKKNKHFLEIS